MRILKVIILPLPVYLTLFIILFCLKANFQTTRFFISAHQDDWQLFINPNVYESIKSAAKGSAAIEFADKKGCHPVDFSGRPMKGYVCIDPVGFD